MPLDLSTLPRSEIADFCRRHGIRRLAIFGSALRDDFTPQSDIDVLVEFEPGVRTGLKFFRIQDDLSALFRRQVDLNTPDCLSKYFKQEVLEEARDLYVAAAWHGLALRLAMPSVQECSSVSVRTA